MPFLYNDPSTKPRRRTLRRDQSDAERALWRILRNKQMEKLKFYRQYSVGPYYVDFYCPNRRFAIEVDGGQHGLPRQELHDARRTAYLQQHRIRVIRFWNLEVLQQIEVVWEKIREALHAASPTASNSPSPPLR